MARRTIWAILMASMFTITLYMPDGSTQDYKATVYTFQEGGRLHFTESGSNKQYVTTLPYLVQPA
jgi:hypothetical protein